MNSTRNTENSVYRTSVTVCNINYINKIRAGDLCGSFSPTLIYNEFV